MHIQLLRADVQSLKLDAIVAPADAPPSAHSGASVSGGNLLARFVINVSVPAPGDPDAERKLHRAVLVALEKGEELAVASVGFPPVGIPCGFSVDECARIMVAAALEHARRARSLQRAIFCLYGREEHEVFQRVLAELEKQ